MQGGRGRKAGVTGEEGRTEGILGGRGGGGRWAEWDMGVTQRGAGQPDHLRGRSGLRRQHIPSFEIISRKIQT